MNVIFFLSRRPFGLLFS